MNKYSFILLLTFIYCVIGNIYGLYFWYLWSQTHGFLSSLLIGPFVGIFKGLLWPFFM